MLGCWPEAAFARTGFAAAGYPGLHERRLRLGVLCGPGASAQAAPPLILGARQLLRVVEVESEIVPGG